MEMMPDLSECTAFSLTSWLNVPTMHILHLRIFPRKSSMSRGRECHQNISKPQNVRLIQGSLNYGRGYTNISIFQEWLIDRTTQSNKQNRNSIANVWNMTWPRMNLSFEAKLSLIKPHLFEWFSVQFTSWVHWIQCPKLFWTTGFVPTIPFWQCRSSICIQWFGWERITLFWIINTFAGGRAWEVFAWKNVSSSKHLHL